MEQTLHTRKQPPSYGRPFFKDLSSDEGKTEFERLERIFKRVYEHSTIRKKGRILTTYYLWSFFSRKRMLIFLEAVYAGKDLPLACKETRELTSEQVDMALKACGWEL